MKGELTMLFLKLFIVSFIVFFAVDMIWLGLIARKLYQNELGHILSDQVRWVPAMLFYVLFLIGLVLFVILPGVDKASIGYVMLYGALFGLITYATYDLTNLATLQNWPIKITIIDLAWGTFLGFSVSTVTYLINTII